MPMITRIGAAELKTASPRNRFPPVSGIYRPDSEPSDGRCLRSLVAERMLEEAHTPDGYTRRAHRRVRPVRARAARSRGRRRPLICLSRSARERLSGGLTGARASGGALGGEGLWGFDRQAMHGPLGPWGGVRGGFDSGRR